MNEAFPAGSEITLEWTRTKIEGMMSCSYHPAREFQKPAPLIGMDADMSNEIGPPGEGFLASLICARVRTSGFGLQDRF